MPDKKKTGTHKTDEAEKRMVKRGPVALWTAIRTTGAVLADARHLGQSERKEDGGGRVVPIRALDMARKRSAVLILSGQPSFSLSNCMIASLGGNLWLW